MPILKSSEKDLRRTARRRERNKAAQSAVRTAIKKVREQIEKHDGSAARQAMAVALPVLDRAADKGIIHKNAAARTKSRLAGQIAKLSSQAKA